MKVYWIQMRNCGSASCDFKILVFWFITSLCIDIFHSNKVIAQGDIWRSSSSGTCTKAFAIHPGTVSHSQTHVFINRARCIFFHLMAPRGQNVATRCTRFCSILLLWVVAELGNSTGMWRGGQDDDILLAASGKKLSQIEQKIGTRNGRTQHPPSVDVTWIEFRNGFPWAMTVQIGVRVFSFFVTYFLRGHAPTVCELLDKEEAKLFSVYSPVAYLSSGQNRRNRCPNHWWHVRDQLLWFRESDFEVNQRVLVRCSSARTWLRLSYHFSPKLRAEPNHLYKHFWHD